MQQEQKKSEPQTESRNLHHEDLALKTAAQYFGEELMPLLGITGKAKYVAPTELIKLEARQMYQDSTMYRQIIPGSIWNLKVIPSQQRISDASGNTKQPPAVPIMSRSSPMLSALPRSESR